MLRETYIFWKRLGHGRYQAGLALNLGLIYRDQGRWRRALRWFTLAEGLSQRVHDPWIQALAQYNAGSLWSMRGDFKRALDLLQKSLCAFRNMGHQASEGSVLVQIGDVFVSLGNVEKAWEFLERAHELLKESPPDRIHAGTLLAEISLHQEEWIRVRVILSDMIRLYRSIPDGPARSLAHAVVLYLNPSERLPWIPWEHAIQNAWDPLLLRVWAQAYMRKGDSRTAVRFARTALKEAFWKGHRVEVWRALTLLSELSASVRAAQYRRWAARIFQRFRFPHPEVLNDGESRVDRHGESRQIS